MRDLREYEANLAALAGIDVKNVSAVGIMRLHIALISEATIGDITKAVRKTCLNAVAPIHPGLAFTAKIPIRQYLLEVSSLSIKARRELFELWAEGDPAAC